MAGTSSSPNNTGSHRASRDDNHLISPQRLTPNAYHHIPVMRDRYATKLPPMTTPSISEFSLFADLICLFG